MEADELYKKGKYDEAIRFYDKAALDEPQNAELWNSRGLALCRLSRHIEAIESFDRALGLIRNTLTHGIIKELSFTS